MNRTLPDRIFICGFMGAGKSTAGKALARRLDVPFHDLDEYIVENARQSIPDIFKSEGEEAFRRREQAALLDIIRHKKGVIALGGGTLQNQHLVDHIKVNGLLVRIKAPLEVIIERLSSDTNRPLLLDDDGQMKSRPQLQNDLASLLHKREPMYEQAEVTVQAADYATVDDLADQLTKKIKYHVALH